MRKPLNTDKINKVEKVNPIQKSSLQDLHREEDEDPKLIKTRKHEHKSKR